jgi:ribosomal protein L37E
MGLQREALESTGSEIQEMNTTFEQCSQCGNQALLLEGNNGVCLSCLFPAPPREPLEGSFIEGCECERCKKSEKTS